MATRKLCKRCKHWTPMEDHKKIGDCDSPKFVYGTHENTPVDGMSYVDDFESCAGFSTGSDFGCIYFEKREKKVKE